jgi:deoxyribodipyrimidine photo-lyase
MSPPGINLVWFKRDLRLKDHTAVCKAIESGGTHLLFFCLEPDMMSQPDADIRHWRFALQAAEDLQRKLKSYGIDLLICHREVEEVLDILRQHYTIRHIFSHQETGNKASFDRDKRIKKWCSKHGVIWQEAVQDGIIRGQKHRRGWGRQMNSFLNAPLQHPNLSALKSLSLSSELMSKLKGSSIPHEITNPIEGFQYGGETLARRYWQSFLAGRGKDYGRFMSKPHLSRRSCSRLSPYLAWGNISIRELWQYCQQHEDKSTPMGRALHNFKERLWWRGHYLQKLEAEWKMEFEPINRGFEALDRVYDEQLFQAWANGNTGYPMVDASIRCLKATGWINFRMRAMLATFATFTLWLPLPPVALHLARLFLDYEPGIHYPQLQMQAGLTGYHTLRIYNPTVQAEKNDPDGAFIHQWIPELRSVPVSQCHEPWQLTPLEQQLYQCKIGEDYPQPIVDFRKANTLHRDRYWALRTSPAVQKNLPVVWQRHCLPESIKTYRKQLGQS